MRWIALYTQRDAERAPMQGTILSNRYLIAEEIGVGGMGNVYRATDLRTGGDVAVKVPHAFLARNLEYVERLRREAQIAASVYSPRVVRVIDLDTHEGLPYLVMEYVPGETLADIARQRGRFTLQETLLVGLEVARALDAAHAKGIIHRDLKPQNIKLVDGEVKVLDFGIAKGEGFANVTAASVFMGTPEYCAPERAEGEGDIRSDIYSLGVILFEMHEGHIPFQAATPLALMKKHESEPPPPLTGDVPREVQEIVARCLAKYPDDRYQTPRELVQALRAVLEAPTLVPTPTATPAGVAPTIRSPRDLSADGDELPSTLVAPAAAPSPAPPSDGRPAPTVHAPTAPADRPRRAPVLPILGVALAVVLGGAVAVLLLGGRNAGDAGTGDTAPDTSPAPNVATEIARGSVGGTASPTAAPAAPLLAPGERRSLAGVGTVEFPLPESECPGVKTVLQLASIAAEASGRVTVSYSVQVPRVAGVECVVDYGADAGCACMVLQTRLASGRVVEVRNSGGSGVSATGAEDIYGRTALTGAWIFDRVDLSGDELTLLRFVPGIDAPTIRLPLLRR